MTTPVAAAALSVPRVRTLFSVKIDGRPRLAGQTFGHGGRDRLEVDAGLDQLGLGIRHGGDRRVDADHPLPDVADRGRGGDHQQPPVAHLQEALRHPRAPRRHCRPTTVSTCAPSSSGRSRTTNGMPSRSRASRAANVPSQGTAITPAGRQAISASICRVSSAGSPLLVATADARRRVARLALQPVDHLGEEGVGELGHDRADDRPLRAAQRRRGDVAPIAELIDDPAHARGQLRVDVTPAGQDVGYRRWRDGGRARHIVDRRSPPDAAPSSGDVTSFGQEPPQKTILQPLLLTRHAIKPTDRRRSELASARGMVRGLQPATASRARAASWASAAGRSIAPGARPRGQCRSDRWWRGPIVPWPQRGEQPAEGGVALEAALDHDRPVAPQMVEHRVDHQRGVEGTQRRASGGLRPRITEDLAATAEEGPAAGDEGRQRHRPGRDHRHHVGRRRLGAAGRRHRRRARAPARP